MNLKIHCALFLLALVACQAAPSPKIIEKKSISDVEIKTGKDDLKLEDDSVDKDRTKKSATTFCVEIRSGSSQQVPCKEKQPARPSSVVNVPPPVHVIQPAPPKEILQPLTIVQPVPSAPVPQTVHVIQPQQPSIKLEPLPQTAPQQVHTVHYVNPMPQPQSHTVDFVLPSSQSAAAIPAPQSIPHPPPQVIQIPPAQPQSANIILPAPSAPQAPAFNVIHSPPAPQTPIVNIVPAPAVPCNPPATYSIVQPQPVPQPVHMVQIVPQIPQPAPPASVMVVQQETRPEPVEIHHVKPEPVKIEEIKPEPVKIEVKPVHKPAPKPVPTQIQVQPLPEPIETVDVLPLEPMLCKHEQMIVVPSSPLMLVSEQEVQQPTTVIQVPSMGHNCRPHHLSHPVISDCNCRYHGLLHRSKTMSEHIASPSWPRTHSKIQEHHVMMYPGGSIAPSRSPLMVQCSPNFLPMGRNASPLMVGAHTAKDSSERTRNTMVSVHTGMAGHHAHPLYHTTYSNPYHVPMHGVEPSYGPYHMQPHIHDTPAITVSTYSPSGSFYRASEPMIVDSKTEEDLSMNNEKSHKSYPVVMKATDHSKIPNTQKREADFVQLKEAVEQPLEEAGTINEVTLKMNDVKNTK